MFFVTDVETCTTIPTYGGLLTVGCVAVSDEAEIVDSFYMSLAYSLETADESTMKFWEDQAEVVRDAAFNWSYNRLHPSSAVLVLKNWVESHEPDKAKAIFTANPASFDYPWFPILFAASNVEDPFSHRTLCLRSMRYGLLGGTYGEKRGDFHNPEQPHHALSDAMAEAEDLIYLLKQVNGA